jgi:uncharacterized protein (TIGR02588 family)
MSEARDYRRNAPSGQHGDQAHEREQEQGTERAEHVPPGLLEKIATAGSALLIAAVVGLLIWDAFRTHAVASFSTHVGKGTIASGVYSFPIDVKNSGDEAARSVIVHVELAGPDTTMAESDLEIDWLPGRSTRRIVAVFDRRRSSELPGASVTAEVRGYVVP